MLLVRRGLRLGGGLLGVVRRPLCGVWVVRVDLLDRGGRRGWGRRRLTVGWLLPILLLLLALLVLGLLVLRLLVLGLLLRLLAVRLVRLLVLVWVLLLLLLLLLLLHELVLLVRAPVSLVATLHVGHG